MSNYKKNPLSLVPGGSTVYVTYKRIGTGEITISYPNIKDVPGYVRKIKRDDVIRIREEKELIWENEKL